MTLLLNSDITNKVNTHIRGKIARIGGRVDQLLEYKNCSVKDINVKDGGYGAILNIIEKKSIVERYKSAKEILFQELRFILRGSSYPRDRKTELLDMHFAFNNKKIKHYFDACISSNVIEHSPNPIFLLLNFYYITKRGGYQYHAIPNYEYTWDSTRKPTSIEHLISDFENGMWVEDKSHNDDYIQAAITISGWQKKLHEKYPISYPFIHFHVFNIQNTRELFEFIFEDVTVDVIRNEKFGDNLVIFKNEFNAKFRANYLPLVDKYLNGKIIQP